MCVVFVCDIYDISYFLSCIAENNSLGNGEGVIEVAECVEFPLFALNSNEKLLNAFKRQLITVG